MKNAVITGVSRGMGEKTAEKFLSEGWYVIGTSTSGKSSIQNDNFEIHKLNYLEPNSIDQFVQTIKDSGKKIDALLNSAGVYLDDDEYPLTEKPLRNTLEVNLIGPILLTQKLLPLLNDGGAIVNMSSQMGAISDLEDSEAAPAYRISKAGVNMFTRTLARHLESKHITVSSMDPGWVRTDMGGSSAPRDPKDPAREMYELATSKVDSGHFWRSGKKRTW